MYLTLFVPWLIGIRVGLSLLCSKFYLLFLLEREDNLCRSVHLPTLQQHVDTFITHSMPVVIVAWVSIVQSRQLGTHKLVFSSILELEVVLVQSFLFSSRN